MPGKHTDDLNDHTVQGIWEAHLLGRIDEGDVVDDITVRSEGMLAEKGYWVWMFTSASKEPSSWQDLRGDYWMVNPDARDVREWGT
jgi:hypothetical protein